MITERKNGEVIAQYEYGYLDKVTQVTRGTEVTQFHYNARGMLVAKERDGQIIETFGWDGIGLIAKGETVYANEAHASGGVPLAAIDAGDQAAELQYYDSDYLGTTTAVYSAEGDVQAKLIGSYGADAESEELRFTGKPYDADLDAHVFPYRNYRADVGRWASADPAGFPDGPNQHYYACVPTMGLDPLGLYTQEEIANHTGINHAGSYSSSDVDNFNSALYGLHQNGGEMGQALVDAVMSGQIDIEWDSNRNGPAGGPGNETDPNPLLALPSGDPNFLPDPINYFGTNYESEWQSVDESSYAPLVVIGHELGHALLDLDDVNGNLYVENEIRDALGLPLRETHHGDLGAWRWEDLSFEIQEKIKEFEL